MTPSTFAGRMFCIFYAFVGIPLFMLTLKVIGDKINELLGNFFNIISTKRQLRDRKGTKIKVMLTLTGLVLGPRPRLLNTWFSKSVVDERRVFSTVKYWK